MVEEELKEHNLLSSPLSFFPWLSKTDHVQNQFKMADSRNQSKNVILNQFKNDYMVTRCDKKQVFRQDLVF